MSTVPHDAYAELAFAILIWDHVYREGTRKQQTEAEQRLRDLADSLRDAGYGLKVKDK